jgi:DNA-binding NtrC family response regulator
MAKKNDMTAQVQQVQQRFSIIGQAPAVRAAIERALRVAKVDLSVLVVGESGSGKEHFPKIIFENSPRKHKKYIAVNCGAIPEGTIDSELFGHVKGSFTGADKDHKGYFEEANGGMIFLDEVAEMPLSTQARLLRVLESGEYIKVGSSTVQKTDVRIVAATNKDLPQAIKEGKFREDLFYRLSTVQIDVPPLRERGDDILLLTRKFLHDFVDNNGVEEVTLDESARRRLMGYHWPGNVRQLKNIIEQVALFEAGTTVTADTLNAYLPKAELATVGAPAQVDYSRDREVVFAIIAQLQKELNEIREQLTGASATAALPHYSTSMAELRRESNKLGYGPRHEHIMPPREVRPTSHDIDNDYSNVVELSSDNQVMDVEATHVRTLEETERDTIIESLKRNGNHRKATAQELQISERTLYRKIKQYNLDK